MIDIIDCDCPPGVLETILSDECKTHRLPKTGRIYFQKVDSSNNFVEGINGIETAAAWTGLTASVGDDKVSVTPFIVDMVWGETESTDGSQNFDGATTKSGILPSVVTVMIEDPSPGQVAVINGMFCQDNGSLGVFFVFSNDAILANNISDSPNEYGAIPISPETFIGSAPGRESDLGSRFKYSFQFALAPSWYQNSKKIKAEAGFSYMNDVIGV